MKESASRERRTWPIHSVQSTWHCLGLSLCLSSVFYLSLHVLLARLKGSTPHHSHPHSLFSHSTLLSSRRSILSFSHLNTLTHSLFFPFPGHIVCSTLTLYLLRSLLATYPRTITLMQPSCFRCSRSRPSSSSSSKHLSLIHYNQ